MIYGRFRMEYGVRHVWLEQRVIAPKRVEQRAVAEADCITQDGGPSPVPAFFSYTSTGEDIASPWLRVWATSLEARSPRMRGILMNDHRAVPGRKLFVSSSITLSVNFGAPLPFAWTRS